jgi:ribosomal protein S14
MEEKIIPVLHHKSKNFLVKSKSSLKISRSLIIPESNVRNTKSESVIHKNFAPKKRPKDDLCTHCGVRQKGPGFRFLCRYCFRKAGDETVYSINSGTMNKDMFSQKFPW